MYNVMGNTVKCLLFLSGVLKIDAKSLRGRLDIVEKRMSVVESRVSADNELAKEMFVSLQQNFDEFNNSMLNFKDQMCPIMNKQTGKKEQSNSAKRVEHLKSSQVLVLLGLKREKQWTRNQMKNLTIQLTEHSAQLEKHFENLTDQIHLQNDQLTKSYSKFKIEMTGKSEMEKKWTRNQVEKLTGLVNEQTDLLDQNFSELKNELKNDKEEIESNLEVINAKIDDKIQTKLSKLDEIITNNVKDIKEVSAKIDDKFQTKLSKLDEIITNNVKDMNEVSLKSDTTEKLISRQQREIEALKETQAKLLNVLINYKCPSDWTKYSSYCYLFVDEEKTFSEARAHCKRLGATLPDIENEAENTFIHGLIGHRSRGIWIGYSDEKEEGTWISERTGQPASFTNFHTGQPNGGTRENCAYMETFYPSSLWGDGICDFNGTFVCKKDAKMDIKF
ncbi:oxidized low-density lipoprotein receptor 1-like [Ruditapes philippinarum]|uniref:oxidized low-density lipoprotein receptor 1-like n=1 Tax=Ruditapes philippinarum TaxID=129788 RepID=UPI00295B7F4A|nr:oxidized low-density lipoprotein receptor 1-like [Ruditapes philippinarum]